MELGSRIATLRKDNGISQAEFAYRYHVTQQAVSSWEHGKSYPDLETLIHISDDYSISLDDLIKDDRELVKAIDRRKSRAERARNLYRTVIAVVILLSIVFLIAIDRSTQPTSDENRINGEDGISMIVSLPHMNPSRAISYTVRGSITDKRVLERTNMWSKTVLGKTERDIPGMLPEGSIRLHFQDTDHNDIPATELKTCVVKLLDIETGDDVEIPTETKIDNGDILIHIASETMALETDHVYGCIILAGYMLGNDEYTSITGVGLQRDDESN